MMSDDVFDGKLLADKLARLNSSQQSIESLSKWCIRYRDNAKQIVETWDKSFKSAQRERRVSFLYLANDIIQNSRRKGSEFVNEFWKFLPEAVKFVYEGDENGKKAASRLVQIWEERKLFGSRGQNLKDELLGVDPPSAVSNGKSSNPIKVVKRDALSLRIKLAVGGFPEKIISAFHLVHDGHVNEEAAIDNCRGAVSRIKEMEKDIESSAVPGNLLGQETVNKVQEEENILREYVIQLENAQTARAALVSCLKEALQDQETKLDMVCNELQVARGQINQTVYMKQKLTSPSLLASQAINPLMEAARVAEPSLPSARSTSSTQFLPTHLVPFTASKLNEEESKKAAAAAVAAKLAASTSSAQMLTSVLSSLVAEEAASKNSGLNTTGFSSSLPFSPPEKRLKLEKPPSLSEMNHSEGSHPAFFASGQQQPASNLSLAQSTSMQVISQGNQIQSPFLQPPPPPPPPSLPPANTPATQLGQSAAMLMGAIPYGYGASNLPPPPLPSHVQMGFARPAPLPTQQPPPQQLQTQQPQQQQPANGGFYRPPGIGFYAQSHQSATQPVPRQ